MVYRIRGTDENIKNLKDNVLEKNAFQVLDMKPDKPYEFKPIIDIYGVEIKIFENIFSILIQKELMDY